MRPDRRAWDGIDAAELAAGLRAAIGAPEEVAAEAAALVESVRRGGDARLLQLGEELDGVRVEHLEVAAEIRAEQAGAVSVALQAALQAAAQNIRAVARAQVRAEADIVAPGQGQTVTVREVAVGSAGIYVPGGRAAYPSSVLMGAIPAREAGVDRVVVASPPAANGMPEPAVLAAAEIAGVDAVYAIGGAQAIGALAYGTETVESVDVIAGPGGPWVQEAKLAVSRAVGTDGYAGPSELVVVTDGSVEPRWLALDLCAQAEHGDDGLLVAICIGDADPDALLGAIEVVAGNYESVPDASISVVTAPSTTAALELAEALAPEHLELACAGADSIADSITRAGCVFVGPLGATAFGDYAAGSNHVLPTGGAGRFTGPLGPGTFRRRISTVRMSSEAAVELGPVVDEIARAEGFVVHGASALARAGETERRRR